MAEFGPRHHHCHMLGPPVASADQCVVFAVRQKAHVTDDRSLVLSPNSLRGHEVPGSQRDCSIWCYERGSLPTDVSLAFLPVLTPLQFIRVSLLSIGGYGPRSASRA